MKLSIPTPCEQSWEGMQSVNGGRFCDMCNKQVVDLSSMSDVEIVKLIKKTKEGVCGRLQEQQIDRELRERERQALLPALVLTSVLSAAIPGSSLAQSAPKNSAGTTQLKTTQVELKGVITDLHSGQAVPGVTVRLKDSSTIGTVTIGDGSFRINVPVNGKQDSVNLMFSRMGYDAKELAIGVDEMNQNLELVMCSKVSDLQEVTVVGYRPLEKTYYVGGIIAVKRRTWWQRFWDLFRGHHH